jgi:acetyltransferase-like isoleucine patch superfamily enzyme
LDTTKPFSAGAPPPLRGPFWEEVFLFMQNIDTSALAAAKAKLEAAEAQREEVLLRHIANGVDIRSRNVEIGSEVVIAPGAVILAGTILT